MDSDKSKNNVPQNNEEPAPPGTEIPLPLEQEPQTPISTSKTPMILPSVKGVENAKKRLRAFSIQKKTPITPILLPKSTGSGNTTVLIGKLSSVKLTPKVEDPEHKKLPKPPKPGTSRKSFQDSYTDLQRRTLAEIEDMKRKMELVELGIPLGLICPSSTSEKAMPTKAMPPIKSFLDPAKVDDLIREAKKAKLEGKEFKFDYHKLLPDYDNPFQRKRDEAASHEKDRKSDRRKGETDKDRRKSDKYDSRRHDYKKDELKYKERDRDKFKDKGKGKEEKTEESRKIDKTTDKETEMNLNDYLVCDSWSLDNDDKHSNSSPKAQEKPSNFVASFTPSTDIMVTEPSEQLKLSISKNKEILRSITLDKPLKAPVKMEKLQPVIDSFKFEIDPNDDEILDIFDEDSGLEKYAQTKSKKQSLLYDPSDKNVDYGADVSKETSLDGINDDTFLESVINEIKQEDMSDDGSQDKGLVEYEMSPNREEESPRKTKAGSVTPEIIDKSRAQSQRSDFSEGYRSSDSFKTTDTNESGYKSLDRYRISIEKELDDALESKMSKSTVDSLETWNFVLKICQPLLFRHDKKKCYKETRTTPKIWYTESPKGCSCVKDRSVVYEELEMSKMNLVDRVYGCDQIADSLYSSARGWYPRHSLCPTESNVVPLANEWEAEDSLQAHRNEERMPATPQRSDELSLDREYQRFMEAVWPDVVDSKIETSRSTTPVRQDSRKKKKEDLEKEIEDKKTKKIKLSSECWSQESDLDEEEKSNKAKVEKEKSRSRKRKHSTSSMSSSLSDSDENSTKKRKLLKKKAIKKTKSKSAKRRRIGRKILKKLKEKQSKRKKNKSSEDDDSDKKKDKKIKKKKQAKLKKKAQKKRKVVQTSSSSSSSSSDSSSESDSASDRRSKKAKKRNQERRKKIKKQRKQSSSDSTQSEDLFDVNILNNIKTERLTDDEKGKKLMEFSPRRQKPREIINVKELQNDFVENIHIKKEVEEDLCKEVRKVDTNKIQSDVFDIGSLEPITEISAIEEIELPEDPPIENTLVQPLAPPTVGQHGGRAEAPAPDESNMSQCSSQESVCSVKDVPSYEKDESHLRPSSQNSNYSFNDVISASQNVLYQKGIETVAECEDKYTESYETANYEMYEQLAMAYQSDVASQRACPGAEAPGGERRIETVVRARCGEIKCDWRAGRAPAPPPAPRPSRWGLKPGEVNIVLTGEGTHFSVEDAQPIYQIQSIANRTDSTANTGYDEAYMDMYGASDRLQYGDCFGPDFDTNTVSANISVTAIDDISLDTNVSVKANVETRTSSLDDRINKALRETVLGEVAKEVESVDAETYQKDVPEKGILITNLTTEPRSFKRVSFADGYKPGQDSDVEEPPVKKRKKARRYGCAWPCSAAHADHVPLWDALPPPPPPPGSPPPPPRAAPPAHLLRAARRRAPHPALPALAAGKFDPSIPLPGFMPPEPPPGLISLQ
ncbi:WD repeat-containing protein 87-like [Nymphalis io]|uniref:WD repeat-containing protein 87-like n=1 Tax=Inachis io TaxID=171585 RepID=UPI0021672380|nr:WD repeat-containing protein 87-like [Nymphalis io]